MTTITTHSIESVLPYHKTIQYSLSILMNNQEDPPPSATHDKKPAARPSHMRDSSRKRSFPDDSDNDNELHEQHKKRHLTWDLEHHHQHQQDDDNNANNHASSAAVGAAANDATSNDGWSEEMHRLFVQGIYEVGVKHASPAVILESMTVPHSALTSERVKSHLQKYRNHREKSKEEFFAEYESWMQKALTMGAAGGASSNHLQLLPATTIVEMMGSENVLIGGDAAAHLAYTVMAEEKQVLNMKNGEVSSHQHHHGMLLPDMAYTKGFTGATIPFPTLTEEERRSPLGVSISHVIGLFYSMTQHLGKERDGAERLKATRASNIPVAAAATAAARGPPVSEPEQLGHDDF